MQAPIELPVQAPIEVPVQAPIEVPVQAPIEVPVQEVNTTNAGSSLEPKEGTPAEVVVENPLIEVKVELQQPTENSVTGMSKP